MIFIRVLLKEKTIEKKEVLTMTILEKIAEVKKQIKPNNTPEKNREYFHELVVLTLYADTRGKESSNYTPEEKKNCELFAKKNVDAFNTYEDLTSNIPDPVEFVKSKKKLSDLCKNITREKNKRLRKFQDENGKAYDQSEDAITEQEYQLRASIKGWLMSGDYLFLHYLYFLGRCSGNEAFRKLAEDALTIDASDSLQRDKFIDHAIDVCNEQRNEVLIERELVFLNKNQCKINKYPQEQIDIIKEKNKDRSEKKQTEFWKTHKIVNGKIDFIKEDDPAPDVDINDEKVKQDFETFKNKLIENGWSEVDGIKNNYEQMYRMLFLGSIKQTNMMKPVVDELYNTKITEKTKRSTQLELKQKILSKYDEYRKPSEYASEKDMKKVSELMARDANIFRDGIEKITKPPMSFKEYQLKMMENGWLEGDNHNEMYKFLFCGNEELKVKMKPLANDILNTKLTDRTKYLVPIAFKESIIDAVEEFKAEYGPQGLPPQAESDVLLLNVWINKQRKWMKAEVNERDEIKSARKMEFDSGINKMKQAFKKLYTKPDFYQFWHTDTDEIIQLREAAENALNTFHINKQSETDNAKQDILEAYKKAVNYMSYKMIEANKDPFDKEQMDDFIPSSGMGQERWDGAKQIAEVARNLYPQETAKLDADRLEINYKASVDMIADSMNDESLSDLGTTKGFGYADKPDSYPSPDAKSNFENSLARILTIETLRDNYKQSARTIGKGKMTRSEMDSEVASVMQTVKESPAFKEMLKSNTVSGLKDAAQKGIGHLKAKYFKAGEQVKTVEQYRSSRLSVIEEERESINSKDSGIDNDNNIISIKTNKSF